MTKEEIVREIERRMVGRQSFTYPDLYDGLPSEAYRLADRTIQKWRKKGWISFVRQGRKVVWSLTEEGSRAIAARAV